MYWSKNIQEAAELAKVDQLTIHEKTWVREVAMDIGKQVAHHIETMYPEAVKAASSTFLLSVRNCTYNEILAWLDTDMDTEKRLTFRVRFRRHIRAQYKKIRNGK